MVKHQAGDGKIKFYPEGVEMWDDIRVPMDKAKLGGVSNPNFETFRDGLKAYAFSSSADQELFFSAQIPHSYKLNSDLHPHVHLAVNTTSTGTITFVLEYTIVKIGGDFPASETLSATYTISVDEQYKHIYLDLGDIDGSVIGKDLSGVSAMLLGRVYRDVSEDNFPDDVFLLELDFHFQMDTMGSLEETVK